MAVHLDPYHRPKARAWLAPADCMRFTAPSPEHRNSAATWTLPVVIPNGYLLISQFANLTGRNGAPAVLQHTPRPSERGPEGRLPRTATAV